MNDPYQDAGLGVDDPIPTSPADLEDETRSMEGMVLWYAIGLVSLAAVGVMVFA